MQSSFSFLVTADAGIGAVPEDEAGGATHNDPPANGADQVTVEPGGGTRQGLRQGRPGRDIYLCRDGIGYVYRSPSFNLSSGRALPSRW